MVQSITSNIQIECSINTVWEVLTDFSSYPAWNSFIRSVKGPFAVGRKLFVQIALDASTLRTFKPNLIDFQPSKKMAWRGIFLLPGICDGYYQFELTSMDAGVTQCRHSVLFSGLLVPLIMNRLAPKIQKGFNDMSEALKIRCERM